MQNATWKRIFGLICFISSFGLFILMWILNKNKAALKKQEVSIYSADTSDLSAENKCLCTELLLNIDKRIVNGKSIIKHKAIFDEYCFKLPSLEAKSKVDIIHSFDLKTFEETKIDTVLFQIFYYLTGINQIKKQKILSKTVDALERKDLEDAFHILQKLPEYSLNKKAINWLKDLKQLTETRYLIRLAISRLLSQEKH